MMARVSRRIAMVADRGYYRNCSTAAPSLCRSRCSPPAGDLCSSWLRGSDTSAAKNGSSRLVREVPGLAHTRPKAGAIFTTVGGIAYETRQETARRRVEEQAKVVAVWRETISGPTRDGQPTDLADKMLRLMEAKLGTFRAALARLAN
jgi:hypothetical protein